MPGLRGGRGSRLSIQTKVPSMESLVGGLAAEVNQTRTVESVSKLPIELRCQLSIAGYTEIRYRSTPALPDQQ